MSSLKARLTELYSRLVGRSFTATYEGETKVPGTKLSAPMLSIEDTETIVEDLGDIMHALETSKVWTAISRPDSYHVWAKEVQDAEIGDTAEYEVTEFHFFSCKDWNNPKITAGVHLTVRKCD